MIPLPSRHTHGEQNIARAVFPCDARPIFPNHLASLLWRRSANCRPSFQTATRIPSRVSSPETGTMDRRPFYSLTSQPKDR